MDLLLFNVQDLYIFMDKRRDEDIETIQEPQWQLLSSSLYPNKPLEKVLGIQKIIQETNPDILMLVEVGGRQSLDNFNRHFLNNSYDIHFAASNSDRGIDMAFLTKKGLPCNFYLVNHSGAKLKNGKRFARGLLELRLLRNGKLVAGFLLAHLKSKLDLRNEDFEGRALRAAEVDFIVKRHQRLQREHPGVPFAVCGDFNGIIYREHTEPELQPFANTGLQDVLELLDRPLDERPTYYYFNKSRDRIPMQLDYILLPSKFKEMVSSATRVLPLGDRPPESLAEKREMPSDHLPVFCRLDL